MNCNIEITSGEPVLMGTSIDGNIVCTFSKPTTLKAVLLQFRGEECTNNVDTGKIHTHGKYVHIDVEQFILDTETTVSEGEIRYSFSLEVPLRIPATFNTIYGGILYYLKATVKRYLKIDISFKKLVDVRRPIDLNNYLPALQIKFESSTDRVINYCGWLRGKIILYAEIEKRLFVIGEKINLNIEIMNSSSVKVKKVYCRIIRTITTNFTNPSPYEKTYREFITRSHNFPGVAKHEEVAYSLYVDIPEDLNVPHIKYSRLFKTTFQLQIIAKLAGLNTAMILQFKIYIGHIPINDTLRERETSIFEEDDTISNYSYRV